MLRFVSMSRFANLEFEGREEQGAHAGSTATGEAVCLAEADQALRRGNFEKALRAFARTLEFNPQSVPAWAGQVRMLLELEEFSEAKLWADQALERFPKEPELLAAKAVALARLGDLKAALCFADAAAEEHSATPYVWLARGDVLLARREKRADYCFAKAFAAAPREWLWLWLASRIHSFYQRFAVALKLATDALTLEAAQSVVWLQMGRCQLALGMAQAAQNSLEQARQLDPECLAAAAALEKAGPTTWWRRWLGAWRGARGR